MDIKVTGYLSFHVTMQFFLDPYIFYSNEPYGSLLFILLSLKFISISTRLEQIVPMA